MTHWRSDSDDGSDGGDDDVLPSYQAPPPVSLPLAVARSTSRRTNHHHYHHHHNHHYQQQGITAPPSSSPDAALLSNSSPGADVVRLGSDNSYLFFAPLSGVSAFLPAVVAHTSFSALASLFPCQAAAALFLSLSRIHYPDGVAGSILSAFGTDGGILAILITCRTTIAGARAAARRSAALVGRAERLHGKARTFRRGLIRPVNATTAADEEGTGLLARWFPCIDWSLFQPGSWGRAFAEIATTWTVLACIKLAAFLLTIGNSLVAASVIQQCLKLVLGCVLMFLVVERDRRERPWRDRLASAFVVAFTLCAVSQAVRFCLSICVYFILTVQSYTLRTALILISSDTIGISFCFFLPDIPRLRLVLMRSLAPAVTKFAAIFSPKLVSRYPFVHCGSTPSSTKPEPHLQRSASSSINYANESTEELDCVGAVIASYGFCVRFILGTVSRSVLFMREDPIPMFIIAAIALTWQWLLTALCMMWVRLRAPHAKVLDREPWSLGAGTDLELAYPIPHFEQLLEHRLHMGKSSTSEACLSASRDAQGRSTFFASSMQRLESLHSENFHDHSRPADGRARRRSGNHTDRAGGRVSSSTSGSTATDGGARTTRSSSNIAVSSPSASASPSRPFPTLRSAFSPGSSSSNTATSAYTSTYSSPSSPPPPSPPVLPTLASTTSTTRLPSTPTPNPPFSPWARLRLLALSHYTATLGAVASSFAAGTFRSTVFDALPFPAGIGVAAGAVPAVPYTTTMLWFWIVVADLAGNCAVAWWMSACWGVSYGDDASAAGGDEGVRRAGWDCRLSVGGATDALLGMLAYFFAMGSVVEGIAGLS
ncbi:hypothetical protein DFJ73DRAFT_957843 [Zopfochytrium polystomum]|nr:hypothetical protein DFJ73DRAFT_957843 [Zopfochytrium polystomum]